MHIVDVSVDDWFGTYLDGKLAYEDHGSRYDMIMPKLVGKTIDSYTHVNAEVLGYLEMFGNRLPYELSDLMKALEEAEDDGSI